VSGSMWGSLLRVAAGLVSLVSCLAHGFELGGGAAAGLAAATQLTHCELVECAVSEAAEADSRKQTMRVKPATQAVAQKVVYVFVSCRG
jgi:hypothetical protein